VAKDNLKSKSTVKTAGRWRFTRRVVQALALILFLYLLVGTRREGITFLPHDLFFRLDPLAGISAMVASRKWLGPLALGGTTLILAFAVGRAWCGWVCPLGTILDWTPARRPHRDRLDIPSYWRQAKYLILFTILLAAVLGSMTLLVLDPITILYRPIAGAFLPAFSFIVTTVETWLYHIGFLQPAIEWFDRLVRGWLLIDQPFFWPNLAIFMVLAGILALNAVRPRFWCRYLCPLGALLGLVARVSFIRYSLDEAKCTACQHCALSCPTGAINPDRKFAISPAECTLCLDCMVACPTEAISFKGQLGLAARQHHDPSRRQFLASIGIATAGALLLRTLPLLRNTKQSPIRPPGTSEEQLLSRCIRCGECIRVCPTGGLQPSLSADDWEGLWTPILIPRLGYCDYSCNSCGGVCPTGAIPNLSLSEKRQKVLGVACIDQKRCIPWADGLDCIVCEEMCPIPQKAIQLEARTVKTSHGETTTVLCPTVVQDLCIGCGICEQQCPLDGEAAIRVYPAGDINL
jgi:MauM/NapG family ferredoxin protein